MMMKQRLLQASCLAGILANLEVSTAAENPLRHRRLGFLSSSNEQDVDFAGSAWCPTAVCLNSDVCQPCHRRFLILIATGRSASTTLTYMLDQLPGVRMSGENNDALNRIRHMINVVVEKEQFQRESGHMSPWGHNPVINGSLSCVAQHMIEAINPPLVDDQGKLIEDDAETIVGFKTIRFIGNNNLDELKEFLETKFPCARIVINIRSDVESQVASEEKAFGFDKSKEDQLRQDLIQQNEEMARLADMLGEQRAHLLDSTEWTHNNISKLNAAVAWLGFAESCFFQQLLEMNTQGGGYGAGRTSLHHNPQCHYVG